MRQGIDDQRARPAKPPALIAPPFSSSPHAVRAARGLVTAARRGKRVWGLWGQKTGEVGLGRTHNLVCG